MKEVFALIAAYVLTCAAVILIALLVSFLPFIAGDENLFANPAHVPSMLLFSLVPTMIFVFPGFVLFRATLYVSRRRSWRSFAIFGAVSGITTALVLQHLISPNFSTIARALPDHPDLLRSLQILAVAVAKWGSIGAIMGVVYHRLERRFNGGTIPAMRPRTAE